VCEGIDHEILAQAIAAFQKGVANVVDAIYNGTNLHIYDLAWKRALQNAIDRPSGDLLFIQGPTDVTHSDTLHQILETIGIDKATAEAAKWVTLANGTKCMCVIRMYDGITIEERVMLSLQRLIPGYATIKVCRGLAFIW
jgi:hypothetical protein